MAYNCLLFLISVPGIQILGKLRECCLCVCIGFYLINYIACFGCYLIHQYLWLTPNTKPPLTLPEPESLYLTIFYSLNRESFNIRFISFDVKVKYENKIKLNSFTPHILGTITFNFFNLLVAWKPLYWTHHIYFLTLSMLRFSCQHINLSLQDGKSNLKYQEMTGQFILTGNGRHQHTQGRKTSFGLYQWCTKFFFHCQTVPRLRAVQCILYKV